MQRVCATRGGINAYLADPDRLVTEETRRCPFCKDGHRLRLHGWYSRFALLPDAATETLVAVRRLYCPRKKRTVSLLPDFCLPRRQHGPAVLGRFLEALLEGQGLLEALQAARPDASHHSVAQSLRDGFLRRAHRLRAYLARLRSRPLEPPSRTARHLRPIAQLFWGLVAGRSSVERAFIVHGRRFHRAHALGLA